MYKKELAVLFIIGGASLIVLWFHLRKRRKNRIDALEIETPLLALMSKVRATIALVFGIICFIIGIISLFDK